MHHLVTFNEVKTNWNSPVPDDACEETQYGETEDYSVNIVESLGIQILDDSLVDIFPNPSNGLYNVEVRGLNLFCNKYVRTAN